MTITQANNPLVPHISAHINSEFKNIKGEKAISYSNSIFKRLPETTFVKLQNIKSAILGKEAGDAWFLQLSKHSSEIIKDKKAPLGAVVLAAGGLIGALSTALQNVKVDQSSTFNETQNLPPTGAPSFDPVESNDSYFLPSTSTIAGLLILALASVLAVKSYCSPRQIEKKKSNDDNKTPPPRIGAVKQEDTFKVSTEQAGKSKDGDVPEVSKEQPGKPENDVKTLTENASHSNAQNNSFKSKDTPVQRQVQHSIQPPNLGHLVTRLTKPAYNLTQPADKTINILQKFSYYLKENINEYTMNERFAFLQFQARKLQDLGGLDTVGLFSTRGVVRTTAAMTDSKLIIKNKNVDLVASSIKIMIGECNCLNINEYNRDEIVQNLSAICTSKPLDLTKLAELIKVISNEGYDILINILCCLKIISENKAVNKMSEHKLAIEFAPYLFPVFNLDLTANEILHSNQFDAEAQIIKTLINNAYELKEINENHDFSSARAIKNDKGNPPSPKTWLSPTSPPNPENKLQIDPDAEEVARRLFNDVISSEQVPSVETLLIDALEGVYPPSPPTSPITTSPLYPRSSDNSLSSPSRSNASSSTTSRGLVSPPRLDTLQNKNMAEDLSKYGSQIAGSITNKDLSKNTFFPQNQVNESSSTSLFPSIETIDHEFEGAYFPENISPLFRKFLDQKKSSTYNNEKAVYQLLDRNWDNFWNRLLINGKTRTMYSFVGSMSAKWHTHLTIEEELISSLICTESCFSEETANETVDDAKKVLPLMYTFNFKSARFEELKKMNDPQCFITDFEKPNPFLDEKWLEFFFGLHIPSIQERRNSSIQFTRKNSIVHFDTLVYKKMMLAILTPFVLAANEQARANGAKAFLTLIPIGLNQNLAPSKEEKVIYEAMSQIQAECYLEILNKHETIDNFSELNFSKFGFIDKDSLAKLNINKSLKLTYKTSNNQEDVEKGPASKESFKVLNIVQTYRNELGNEKRTSITDLERRYSLPLPPRLSEESKSNLHELEGSNQHDETVPSLEESSDSSQTRPLTITLDSVDD